MAQSADNNYGEFSGTVYADYYWMARNHDQDLEGENGFWFRRIYLTYEKSLGESFSTRLRLEMDSEGDFLTSSKMIPAVKDAYLKWENEQHAIYAGISSTPTFGLVEDVWGYRPVEKTMLDLQGFASSRDFGLAAKGELGSDGKVLYHVMVGNGNSNRNELNRQKKGMLALGYELTDNLVVQAYGDYAGNPNNRFIYTMQGFIGYRSDDLNVGGLYAYQFRNNTPLNGDEAYNMVSLFTNFSLGKNATGLLRVDHLFDRNPNAAGIDYIPMSAFASSTLLIGGVDIELEQDIHLIPNIEAVLYGETSIGNTPDSDFIPRLTLFYNF